MERSFILVLTLVTLGTATPHGYGVKGGASAKAEASAVAGAFGDLGPIPLSIPSGSSYSGSFSKSSSSSFASSSASSSSSSYSYSGSGANGSPGIGTDKGCSSGICPGAGAPGSSLNGTPQLTGANAVSAAQAKAVAGSYTPCQVINCNSSPSEKCTSGQCLSDSALKGSSGCSGNGNCQSPASVSGSPSVPETPIKSTEDKSENDKHEGDLSDSNDFAVNINRDSQSKLSLDSSGQYSSKEKSYNPESDCSNGNCGSGNSNKINLGSTQSQYPVPSTYLTTPNKNPPCTSPNCNYPSHSVSPQTGSLPSSYNVPIQSATNPPNTYYSSPSGYGPDSIPKYSLTPSAPCTSPSCNSTPYNVGTSSIPNYQFGLQGSSNQGSCASGQCDNPVPSNGKPNNGAISGDKTPIYSHAGIPSNIPSSISGQPGCTTPYCSGVPSYSNVPSHQPNSGCSGAACGVPSLTSLPTKSTDSNAPVYTGGFGGPAGFLDINHGSNKLPGNSVHNYHPNTPYTGQPTGTFGSTPTQSPSAPTNSNELNNNNNNFGSTQTSSNSASTGAFEYNKPSSVPSTPGAQLNPSATSSYGAPTASSAIPIGSHPYTENDGILKPSTNTGSSPSYSGGIHGSAGSSHTTSGSNSVQGSFGVTKPNIPSNSLSGPSYTGNFGGPSGILSGSNLPVGTIGSFNKPGSENCGSTDCNSQTDANVNGGSTSYDKISPTTSISSQNKPVYNDGFGGPTGFLNPNNVKIPSNNPTVSPGNAACANGNCGSKDTPSSGQGTSLTNNLNVAAAAASANAVAYSGGFGGPPGILKPYDENVNIPDHGNTAKGPSVSSNNGHPHSSSTFGKNSELGSSANGANAAAHAIATASATAGSYSGNNNHRNNGASRGCNSGCSPHGTDDSNLGFPNGPIDHGVGGSAIASAKSSAGANAYGNFASSSASAHATAGAATKGGYGRK